ncbi:DUF262 domain-containing protein [Brachyspira murdochii]|uniref:DUF262 domain-containing protein n=1 Tax=Brachyspira murdochii (strain ATCC 51284 / DSM 12563 / 56-150) TaxID=526224 RepID=D5U4K4_BRAM5|nr:DUF262 domain-containing protein [Brachyspira murdochii]ADG70249.1 protein of unknown function DUF262 [Brachyspira murdochii DSM 12563]
MLLEETFKTVKKLLENKKTIKIPNYQRSYSWDEEQIRQFLYDIEEYAEKESHYYVGHFLFEERNGNFYIIDGQQRLTTIVLLIFSIYNMLDDNEDLKNIYNFISKKFSTVSYDNNFFKGIIKGEIKLNKKSKSFETLSQKRIYNACKIFNNALKKQDKNYISNIFNIIMKASCTEHIINKQEEAVQMFIYENNRGKRPTNLDILKSLFMHTIYLNSDKVEKDIKKITNQFKEIFTNIAKIEDILSEDNFLEVTIKTFFNDLKYRGIDDISKYLEENNNDNIPNKIISLRDDENTQKYNIGNKIDFINDFVEELVNNGKYLSNFKDDSKFFYIHSIISLGISVDIYPFIVFLYKENIDKESKKNFIEILENLLIRNRVITTRKRLSIELNKRYWSLLDDSYNFIEDINKQFETADFTWSNNELIKFLDAEIYHHPTAKFLLWKYENYLLKKDNIRYDDKRMKKITLEHILPIEKPNIENHYYGYYDGRKHFKSVYEYETNELYMLQRCLGNYLLLKEGINKAASNSDFKTKLEYYNNQNDNIKLEQQKEIIDNYFNKKTNELKSNWDKNAIEKRRDKIIKAIKKIYKIK